MMNQQTVVIAGGCFWGVAHYFSLAKGVIHTEAGYAQANKPTVNYQETCANIFGAVEVVRITFDADNLSFYQLLDLLFRIIDPCSLNQQGGDIGEQYRVGFYHTNDPLGEAQASIARAFIADQQARYQQPIVFEIQALTQFNTAETYHQAYLEKNPHGYCHVDMQQLQPHERKVMSA
jgi:methionine-S-sulfoxide reductase